MKRGVPDSWPLSVGHGWVSVLGSPGSTVRGYLNRKPIQSPCLAQAWGPQAFLPLPQLQTGVLENPSFWISGLEPRRVSKTSSLDLKWRVSMGEEDQLSPLSGPRAEPEICVQSAQGNCSFPRPSSQAHPFLPSLAVLLGSSHYRAGLSSQALPL